MTLPTSFDYYIAEEIYNETYDAAQTSGMLSSEDMLGFLLLQRLWDADQEYRLSVIKDEIDNLKMKLFRAEFRPHELAQTRRELDRRKEELGDLFYRRHQYDYATIEGLAGLARNNYLLGANLCDHTGHRIWEHGEFWEQGDEGIIAQVMFYLKDQRIEDSLLREIARTEPWRTYWLSSNKQPFEGSVGNYSEDQRSLIMWSKLYDSVLDHPERPSDMVIADHDMLDGWLLSQGEERREKQKQHAAEQRLTANKRINNASQVFIMTNEVYHQHGKTNDRLQSLREVAQITESLNTPEAKMIQQERLAVIKAAGEISGTHLPDVQRELRMKANQAMKG